MKLLILFLFLIQFVFCSGVDLLQNPGHLTDLEPTTTMIIKPINELNNIVIGIMELFPLDVALLNTNIISYRVIVGTLNLDCINIEQQYNNSFFNAITHLNEILDFINNKINEVEKQPNLELTLSTQNPELLLYQLLKNYNIYMQNIIILAMKLIKKIINGNTHNEKEQHLDTFKNEVKGYLNYFQNQLNKDWLDYARVFQNKGDQYSLDYIKNFQNQRNKILLEYINAHRNQTKQHSLIQLNQLTSDYIQNLRNQLNQLYLPETIQNVNTTPYQVQYGHRRRNVHGNGQGQ
ncbi:hypothetical protein Mgra_00003440 [Meloidogyne graminicola]|uniref:Secreted protein n=1 Tax=Meloidogyne graminicola TaxID=189291 RepID=A0A8S9ZU00_9BILA|nr:hypothetical protein Mgra_00003440 [Meloidogyne graminicola]